MGRINPKLYFWRVRIYNADLAPYLDSCVTEVAQYPRRDSRHAQQQRQHREPAEDVPPDPPHTRIVPHNPKSPDTTPMQQPARDSPSRLAAWPRLSAGGERTKR